MIIIKNSKELAKQINENKDLLLKQHDVRIEFQVERGELRDIHCRDLFLMNDEEKFDFNGGNFNGGNFNGGNFNGWDFNGGDFNGGNFNGGNFNGGKISYYAIFISYNNIECESIEGRRQNSFHKCLDGELIIKEKDDDSVEITVEGKTKRISRLSAKELNLIN